MNTISKFIFVLFIMICIVTIGTALCVVIEDVLIYLRNF